MVITYLEDGRREAGLTQQQLAAAAGVNRMTVAAIEGGHKPKEGTARSLCEALAMLGGPGIDPALLHHGRIRSSPEAVASLMQVGRLLSWLPFDRPKDQFWSTLSAHLDFSSSYMRGKLLTIHAEIYSDEDHDPLPAVVAELRHILLFLPPTPETAEALLGGNLFGNAHVSGLWLNSLTEAAWQLWLYADPGYPPR